MRDPSREIATMPTPCGETGAAIEKRMTFGGCWVGERNQPQSATAVTTVITAVALWGWLRSPTQQPPKVIRFSIAAPVSPQGVGIVAISRDGSRIAFVGGSQREIYVRAIDQLEARSLVGT